MTTPAPFHLIPRGARLSDVVPTPEEESATRAVMEDTVRQLEGEPAPVPPRRLRLTFAFGYE